jgi:predicted metal-dependent peptidase
MSNDQLKILLSEVYAVALAKKPIKLYVIYCDTEIADIKEFKSIQELKKYSQSVKMAGRGGTDMKALWTLLKTDRRFKGKPADLTMIFTDIDSRHRQYPRDTRQMGNLVWCILDDPGFTLKYEDRMTKIIHLKSSDVKR